MQQGTEWLDRPPLTTQMLLPFANRIAPSPAAENWLGEYSSRQYPY